MWVGGKMFILVWNRGKVQTAVAMRKHVHSFYYTEDAKRSPMGQQPAHISPLR
jgi:hypothetical protein